MEVLKEWLSETYRRLTTIDNDLTAVPTLPRELEAFRRFFEIQASITKKSESENAHSEYVVKAKQMREITRNWMMGKRKGKAWRNVQIQKRELRAKRIGAKSENQQKISKIDKRIESIEDERKSLRKELSEVIPKGDRWKE